MASRHRGFETGHYGYGLIERALGAALDVGESVQRGALRSRLKRFAQLGLPEPEKGQEGRRLYSQEECHQMLVALLLGNLGLDPIVVARAVKKAWKQNLRRGALEAAQEADFKANRRSDGATRHTARRQRAVAHQRPQRRPDHYPPSATL